MNPAGITRSESCEKFPKRNSILSGNFLVWETGSTADDEFLAVLDIHTLRCLLHTLTLQVIDSTLVD